MRGERPDRGVHVFTLWVKTLKRRTGGESHQISTIHQRAQYISNVVVKLYSPGGANLVATGRSAFLASKHDRRERVALFNAPSVLCRSGLTQWRDLTKVCFPTPGWPAKREQGIS